MQTIPKEFTQRPQVPIEFAFVALLKSRIDFSFQFWMAMAVLGLSLSSHGDIHEPIMMCEVCKWVNLPAFETVYVSHITMWLTPRSSLS